MNYANRDKMNLKLIQLVKPHEILYKTSRGETYTHHDERRIMWQKVAEEMNRLFKLKLRKCCLASSLLMLGCSRGVWVLSRFHSS